MCIIYYKIDFQAEWGRFSVGNAVDEQRFMDDRPFERNGFV
jgi:hypothetical protein